MDISAAAIVRSFMLCHLLRLPRARVAGVGVGLFAPSPSSFFSKREGGGPYLDKKRDLCLTHSLSLSAFAWGGDYAVFPCPELNSGKGGGFFPQSFPCFEGLAHIAQLLCYLAPSLLAQPEG